MTTEHDWPEGASQERPDQDEQPPRRAVPLDWSAFLARDLGPPDFLAGRLMVRGHQVALVGDGKAGKSLFTQEWAWRMAAGLPFLDDCAHAPLKVLYVDMENAEEEIQERLLAFGATPDTLTNLVYLSFPMFRPLNTADGAADLMEVVDEYRPEVVILDTISRMIVGKENDADPWLALYRQTLVRLKKRRISSIRLDHFGKDATRGARGNSTKTQDVDAVWELTPTERGGDLLRLARTHTRSGKGPDELLIRRHGELIGDQWKPGGTWHSIASDEDRPAITPDPMARFTPAARRVLGVLAVNAPIGLTVKDIGDALAGQQGGPLKARTIQDALKKLTDSDLIDELAASPGRAGIWVAR